MGQAEQQIGASWQEVSGTAALVPLGALAYVITGPRWFSTASVPVLELVLMVLPTALIWQPSFRTVMGLAAAALMLAAIQAAPAFRQRSNQQHHVAWLSSWSSGRLRFVSWFRGCVMLWTCACILAVDFTYFPRRFAKATTFGSGLMDVGVGAFVVCGSLVSQSRSRGKAARHAAVLMLLGCIRLGSTAAAGYSVDASEYGQHWNFFFTLGALELLTMAAPQEPASAGASGLLLLGLHQAVLSSGGIEIAHASSRGLGLFSMNKEGLLSLPGRLSKLLTGWVASVVSLALLAWAGHTALQPVSRRACNATYVLWVLAICWGGLGSFACIEAWAAWLDPQPEHDTEATQMLRTTAKPGSHHTPGLHVLEAFNRQGLKLFLVANVITGILNVAFDLSAWTAWQGQSMVVAYLFALSMTGLLLSHKWTCKQQKLE